MLNQSQTTNSGIWSQNEQPYLPKMTTLFIEGLAPRLESKRKQTVWPKKITAMHVEARLKKDICLRIEECAGANLPIAIHTSASGSNGCNTPEDAPCETLKTFMRGISNCFNNLFMGIWGNISLINISTEACQAVRARVAQMERLLQNGAVLVHIIFGYLAENHSAAKHLRLKQLLQEINECALSTDEPLDLKTIEACMLWASKLKSPRRIARSMARVFEQLLQWIEQQRIDILANASVDKTTQKRLQAIAALTTQGGVLIDQLKLYAGDTRPTYRRMRMKALIRSVIDQDPSPNNQIHIETDLAMPLPDIHADRSQLKVVLEHMISNALDAMPQGGRLQITASKLKMGNDASIFAAHPHSDYLTVTISDSGQGMDQCTQARIFEPFFVDNRSSKRIGLGLAVSKGIIRSHGGFIHVHSSKGQGSAFKIFLPISHTDISDHILRSMPLNPPIIRKVSAASCLQ